MGSYIDAVCKEVMIPATAAEKEEKKLRGRIQQLDIAPEQMREKEDNKSKAVKINNRSVAKAADKQSRKSSNQAFPAPSVELVQQAFLMLDPTGSGTLNPYALKEVFPPSCLIQWLGSSQGRPS